MQFPMMSDAELAQLLADDVRLGDLTTHALGIGQRPARMAFTARGEMVAACVEEAARLLELAGGRVDLLARSGERLAAGAPMLTAFGCAGALHGGWKAAQTLVEVASGVATGTRAIVEAAQAARPGVAVACTRKTMPGGKLASVKAILAGGATPHRLGLSETILVFEEHRRFFVDIAPAEIVSRLRGAAPEKRVVVEVASPDEALDWAHAGADVIQAEKFTPDAIGATAQRLANAGLSPLLAAAGGVNAENAVAYVRAGARLLVTSAPYSAPPRDVAVHLAPA